MAFVNSVAAGALAEAVQPRGEVLLQIRCRCSDERSSMHCNCGSRRPRGAIWVRIVQMRLPVTSVNGRGSRAVLQPLLAAPISDNRGGRASSE